MRYKIKGGFKGENVREISNYVLECKGILVFEGYNEDEDQRDDMEFRGVG